MTNQTVPDPWDDSDDHAGSPTQFIWGKVELNRHLVILEKGIGRVAYDPNSHADRKPVKAVDIFLQPLAEMPSINEKQLERRMVNFEDRWVRITHPSLKACGVTDLRTVTGRWAKIELIETGSTYTSKTTGKVFPELAFKFLKLFANEDECRADYQAANGIAATTTVAQPAANGGDAKAKAIPFMKVVVKKAVAQFGPDMTQIANEIAKFPLVKQHFTIDSPEVIEAIGEFAAA